MDATQSGGDSELQSGETRNLKRFQKFLRGSFVFLVIILIILFMLYYKLSVPRGRSRLCFLLYLLIIPLFIVIGGVTFSLAEWEASQEAATRSAHICVSEREMLMENLKASLNKEFSTSSGPPENFTHMWHLIHVAVIKIESCHRRKLFQLAPMEVFVFKNALLYSFGVYTTIGYGNLFPHTIKGRILTVAYAIVGIPLNVAFIADLGELIARMIQRGLSNIRRHIFKNTTDDLCIEYKKFAVVALIALIFTPVLAVIVMRAERGRNWSYIDSLYYTFTTSALIGLGDFVPLPSYVQYFILMPLFFIGETILALMLGFITHLYRYESVVLYKIIKFKILSMLVHRRIVNMQSVRKAESTRHSMKLLPSAENETQAVTTTGSGETVEVDAEIAKLSAREMHLQKKIDKQVEMLEAVPSTIDLGIANAHIRGDGREQRLRNKLRKWLRRHRAPREEETK